MSINNIPINSGTGPKVAVDVIGTANYQVVKIMQATDGSTGSLTNVLAVTNTGVATVTAANVTIASIATGTVSIVGTPAVTAANVTIASITTGTVSIVGTPAVTAANVTIASVTTGTMNVVNVLSASGVTIASMTTGTVNVVNVLSASNVTVASVTTGTMHVTNVLSATGVIVAQVTTLLGTVAVSGGGGGVQYSVGDTTIGATGTGTIAFGIQSGATTARGIAITTTGGLVIGAMPAVGGGVQYSVGDTTIGATGTGTIAFGIQSGATTARGIAITTTGAQHVNVQNVLSAANITIASITTGTLNVINVLSASGVTIASVTTGTMNVINVLSASGVTIASVTTGTMNVVNVLSASGVTIASMTTGTVNVINTVAISGTVSAGLVTTTASVAVIGTAHASRFQAYLLATTATAAGIILKTSGAHTLYITDVLVSVPTPMNVGLYSETTGPLMLVYLAANGGVSRFFTQPLICTTAQSLRVILSSSGTCSLSVVGYTVT